MNPRRDESGPDHSPLIEKLESIDGVVLGTAPHVVYLENNILTEYYRPEWIGVFEENEPIEHLYTVSAPSGGMRKEWYYHQHTLDRYMLIRGYLDLGLYDGRENSLTHGNFTVVSLGEPGSGLPNSIRIPPLVWHSLKWVSEFGLFLNAKTPSYNRGVPDKFRIPEADLPTAITWNT